MTTGHIVLIEDEESLRIVLQTMLTDHGYTVTTAANGQEDVRCLQNTSCDLVITDVMMEELSGFEVMEYMATHAQDIPVIVMTGYTSTESVLDALHHGAYDYIVKPFRFATLLRTIERALEKVQLQRALRQHREELTQPVASETSGLAPTVQRYLAHLDEETGRESEYIDDMGSSTLQPEEELTLFRMIQEALTNAWKHAHTPKVRVELSMHDTPQPTLQVMTQDWGRGFEPSRVPAHAQHFGLQSMHERARTLGDICTIQSRPGHVTVVRIHLPLSYGEAL